jgi:hypothetical protein
MKIIANKLLRKVNSKHYYVKGKGYCFDVVLMDEFKHQKWDVLQVHLNSGRIYEIGKKEFYLNSDVIEINNKLQYLIPIAKMKQITLQGTKTMQVDEITHHTIKSTAKAHQITIGELIAQTFNTNNF